MAQINITLNQDEILQLMATDREGAFKKLLQESLNSFLQAESTEQLNADPYERTEGRTDSRNGFRERNLNTRIGTIVLKVPRHRNSSFETTIFDEYTRSIVCSIIPQFSDKSPLQQHKKQKNDVKRHPPIRWCYSIKKGPYPFGYDPFDYRFIILHPYAFRFLYSIPAAPPAASSARIP